MLIFELNIPESHPCLAGHFINNPIVPAVVLIDEVIQGILKAFPNIQIDNIKQLKFVLPLKPNVVATVHIIEKNRTALKLTIHVQQTLYVKGELGISREEIK